MYIGRYYDDFHYRNTYHHSRKEYKEVLASHSEQNGNKIAILPRTEIGEVKDIIQQLNRQRD